MKLAGDWGQHFRPVGEEQSVADIEENDARFGHVFILLKRLIEVLRRVDGGDASKAGASDSSPKRR